MEMCELGWGVWNSVRIQHSEEFKEDEGIWRNYVDMVVPLIKANRTNYNLPPKIDTFRQLKLPQWHAFPSIPIKERRRTKSKHTHHCHHTSLQQITHHQSPPLLSPYPLHTPPKPPPPPQKTRNASPPTRPAYPETPPP